VTELERFEREVDQLLTEANATGQRLLRALAGEVSEAVLDHIRMLTDQIDQLEGAWLRYQLAVVDEHLQPRLFWATSSARAPR
jgi:hypothetical protein